MNDICAGMKSNLINFLKENGETAGIEDDDWKEFDGFELGSEWKWWKMKTSENFTKPDESYLILPNQKYPNVPKEYLSIPKL